ncbi:unnamed protein product [Symbiodinium sp. CCMP2592]|nr:unnamed protein product [Symbiodinium sp. CCMP2592]
MQNLCEVQDLGQRVDDRLRVLKERFDERLHALQARVTGATTCHRSLSSVQFRLQGQREYLRQPEVEASKAFSINVQLSPCNPSKAHNAKSLQSPFGQRSCVILLDTLSKAASSDEATVVIREAAAEKALLHVGKMCTRKLGAQATCVRLADDVLGVAEGSQKKVEELAGQVGASQRRLEDLERQTEAGLDTLRAENVAVRAELAGRSARWHEGQSGRAEGSSAPLEPTERRELPAASPTEELADAVERRLTSRLGLQVLQLSEVLQRVVQSQATLTQQLTSGPAGAKAKARSSRSVDGLKPASAACAEPRAASEDRKQAIEEPPSCLRLQ